MNSEQSGDFSRRGRAGLHAAFFIVGAVLMVGVAAGALAGCSGEAGPTSAAAATPSSSAPTVPSLAPSPPVRSLVIPKAVGDYHLLTGDEVTKMAKGVRKSLADDPNQGQYAKIAKIGVFGDVRDPQHPLLFVGLAGKDDPRFAAELKSHSPSDELSRFSGATETEGGTDYPPGRLGGALRCGKSADGRGTWDCTWADASTVGTVFTDATSGVEAARTVTALRQAAER